MRGALSGGVGARGAALAWVAAALMGGCGDGASVDNRAPIFVDLAAEAQGRAGEVLAFTVTVEDPDGDPVSVRMEKAPADARFVFSTFGRFVWTPGANDADGGGAEHEVHFAALDSQGARQSHRMILRVFPSEGVARFTTTNSRVLDLSRNERLVAQVAVQDDDALRVEMTLEDAPEGMALVQEGDKEARLEWSPSAEQADKKLIWGVRVVATSGAEVVAQDLTITLLPKSCGEDAAVIQHTPLETQRGVEDFVVTASVAHPTGEPVTPRLFYRIGGDPDDSGGFEGVAMLEDDGLWSGVIPNPVVNVGEVMDVFYFLTATQDRPGAGAGCAARSPGQGRHSFAVFSPGDTTCRRDSAEPNDDPGQAPVVTDLSSPDGLFELYGMSLCEGDVDLFAVDLEAGQGVDVVVFDPDGQGGERRLRLLSFDGQTVLAEDAGDLLVTATTEQARRVFAEFSGDPANYQIFFLIFRAPDLGCAADPFEPDDSPEQAAPLGDGLHVGLTLCDQDRDYYAIEVQEGERIEIDARFVHADGDLDMSLKGANGRPLAASLTSTDDERIVWQNDTGLAEIVKLDVRLFRPGTQVYDLELTRESVGSRDCAPDDYEPNERVSDVLAVSHEGFEAEEVTLCGDADLYPFDLVAGQRLTASIAFDPMSDIDLALITFDEDTLEDSTGLGATESVDHTAESDGVVFVKVYSVREVRASYTLDVALGPASPFCPDDDLEPDGDFEIATPLQVGDEAQAAGLCPLDEDWFVVVAEPFDLIDVRLQPGPGAPRLDFDEVGLEIYDADGTSLLSTGVDSGDTATDFFEAGEEGQRFFIRVVNRSAQSRYDYQLALSFFL